MTRIAAQLAPQRSTQYANLARDLAAAEVLASPLGPGLQDVSLRSIAGQDYLQFDLPGPITNEVAGLLASMAMLGGVFETFDSIGDVSGPLLRPVPAAYPAKPRKARRNVSWTRSSASCGFRTMRNAAP